MTGLVPTGRRLRVQHNTRYVYEPRVGSSYNEARMLPRNEPRQQVLEARLDIDPVTWRFDYLDYWGTTVTSFEAHVPHDELNVTSTVVADIAEAGDSPQTDWERLRSERTVDAYAETLVSTPRSAAPPELAEMARSAIGGAAPHEAGRIVCGLINDAMEYAPGSTTVQTKAGEAWAARRGVCQDLTHLALGGLRAVGIPARYVSGYVAPRGASEPGEPMVGESHSWVEWWSGGWYGWDPTSDAPAGSRHLAVGRGRDYGDVAPFKGVVAGTGKSSLDVSVVVTILG